MDQKSNNKHIPVMLDEVLKALNPLTNKVIIDATFGGGSYSRALLQAGASKVIAFDRDADAIARAQNLVNEFGKRFEIIHACFSEMEAHIKSETIDAVVFDFGVSSFQLDEAERGFSFAKDGPLDMRMGIGAQKNGEQKDAAYIINNYKEQELADIIYHYGDEPRAYQIARVIVENRKKEPFVSTLQFASLVRKHAASTKFIDSATKTFQAFRIYVNEELKEISDGIIAAQNLINKDGLLITVAFHSLEERLVKQQTKLKWNSSKNNITTTYYWDPLYKKPLAPTAVEIEANPRSRSSKLRAFRKCER